MFDNFVFRIGVDVIKCRNRSIFSTYISITIYNQLYKLEMEILMYARGNYAVESIISSTKYYWEFWQSELTAAYIGS